jgi:protein SCO1/2
MTRTARYDGASAVELAAHIDAVRRGPDAAAALTAMLAEQGPLFSGRGSNEAERLRGYILAGFESTGLPQGAVPFVLEELELGIDPYTVAGAARALNGASEIPVEAPALLVAAIARLRNGDDIVSFEYFGQGLPSADSVTAITELARALAALGPLAEPALADLEALLDREGETFSPAVRRELENAMRAIEHSEGPLDALCCAGHGTETARRPGAVGDGIGAGEQLEDLALQSQDGTRLTFSEAFLGRPTALAFFYTRCNNPMKCSLTVTRLGRLAALIEEERLDANVAGITYDPAFDRPERLRTYGADRGMVFSPRCRLWRTIAAFEPLREALDLGVGFGPVTVNRHRLDLVVLDASLGVAERFERRLWDESAALAALRRAASE